jgi:xylose isomerase
MAGLNFLHGVAQAWEAGKLFHIDLNDQNPGRYDQDFRFGSANLKSAFWLVKFLEDVGYDGSRHFDAHAYRTENYDGVKDFARGCMRTYLMLKEKAAQWNADQEIRAIVKQISFDTATGQAAGAAKKRESVRYSKSAVKKLLAQRFDLQNLAERSLPYERLDQLTIDLLLGTR